MRAVPEPPRAIAVPGFAIDDAGVIDPEIGIASNADAQARTD
jgi:hypothetical protein